LTAHRYTQNNLDGLKVILQNKKAALAAIEETSLGPKMEELLRLDISEEAAKAAQARLDRYAELLSKKAAQEARIEILIRSLTDDQDTLYQLQTIEQQAESELAWSDYSGKMRHILHRDNLPKVVAQYYLEIMQEEINKLLIRFDCPFIVLTDDTLSFEVQFKDRRKMPAARLSGGEKVLLAIAFRVVVNDVFARDLGLLCLDEPTAGLDDGNLSCLKIAIERLKELSSSRGLQLIMITHEKDLSYLFDHKIELGKE
jgi:DNA repair exonuclease SbcCD ATPase subunit